MKLRYLDRNGRKISIKGYGAFIDGEKPWPNTFDGSWVFVAEFILDDYGNNVRENFAKHRVTGDGYIVGAHFEEAKAIAVTTAFSESRLDSALLERRAQVLHQWEPTDQELAKFASALR